MRNLSKFFAILFLFTGIFSFPLFAQNTLQNLQCEYLENPLGIDAQSPRFTWQISSKTTGLQQESFTLIVGTDSLAVLAGKGNCWLSEKIHTKQALVSYMGKPLAPFTRYFWSVQI